MFVEIIQRIVDTNTIVRPNEVTRIQYWEMVFKRELQDVKCPKNDVKFYIYFMIGSQNYCENQKIKKTMVECEYMGLMNMLDNPFISNEMKSRVTDIWMKSKRIYFALSKLKNIYKLKKSVVRITTDLYLNPIDFQSRTAMAIYQNGLIYWFTLQDLMNHIKTAIGNCSWWFPQPLEPKNPYTNIMFSKSTLYNIYFKIKESSYLMPALMHNYFLCEFNLEWFRIENEYLIRDTYIKRYVSNSTANTLWKDAVYILFTKNIIIDDYFPENVLMCTMRPYLYLYYMSRYSVIGTDKCTFSGLLFESKLNEFSKNNRKFGRKIIKIKNNVQVISYYTKTNKALMMRDISGYYCNVDKFETLCESESSSDDED